MLGEGGVVCLAWPYSVSFMLSKFQRTQVYEVPAAGQT